MDQKLTELNGGSGNGEDNGIGEMNEAGDVGNGDKGMECKLDADELVCTSANADIEMLMP